MGKIKHVKFRDPVIVKFRFCKNCPHSCNWEPESGIVGCISWYLESSTDLECFKRVWFNENHELVDYWRWPTLEEGLALLDGRMSHEEFEEIKKKEFEKLKEEVKRLEFR